MNLVRAWIVGDPSARIAHYQLEPTSGIDLPRCVTSGAPNRIVPQLPVEFPVFPSERTVRAGSDRVWFICGVHLDRKLAREVPTLEPDDTDHDRY